MKWSTLILIVFLLLLIGGLYGTQFSLVHRDAEINVDAQYTNGILTASSILFGIWAIVIERKPEGKTSEAERSRWQYENIIPNSFFICLSFLVFSVLLMALTALGAYSPMWALVVNTIGFMLNVVFLSMTLHYYKFKG